MWEGQEWRQGSRSMVGAPGVSFLQPPQTQATSNKVMAIHLRTGPFRPSGGTGRSIPRTGKKNGVSWSITGVRERPEGSCTGGGEKPAQPAMAGRSIRPIKDPRKPDGRALGKEPTTPGDGGQSGTRWRGFLGTGRPGRFVMRLCVGCGFVFLLSWVLLFPSVPAWADANRTLMESVLKGDLVGVKKSPRPGSPDQCLDSLRSDSPSCGRIPGAVADRSVSRLPGCQDRREGPQGRNAPDAGRHGGTPHGHEGSGVPLRG